MWIYWLSCRLTENLLKNPLKSDSKPTDFIFPIFKNHINYDDPVTLHNSISASNAFANKKLRLLIMMAGIDKKISFHCSRHSFAVRALRKGMRIEYVSKLMGHSDIKTTQIYAKIVNSELETAMDIMNY